MSVNHFFSDLPEGHWWAQPQQPQPSAKTSAPKHNNFISTPDTNSASNFWTNSQFNHHQVSAMACNQNSAFNFDLNNEDDEEIEEQMTDERENSVREEGEGEGHFQEQLAIAKEPLFEKPLTPSDVGKLNRLVIPKQHAEKHFPLNGNGSESGGGEKGLQLSFEDELGKPWRFRYSYWNSSQSYVLTKGWSRFVKEKRLDAGDIVLFQRDRLDGDRLFIGWKRRSVAAAANPGREGGVVAQPAATAGNGGRGGSSTGGWTRLFFSGHSYPPQYRPGPAIPYQPDCIHAASVLQGQTTPSANSKRVRLFGVNLECQPDEPTPDGSSASSQDQGQDQDQAYFYHHHYYQQYYPKVHAYNDHSHMDINFSRDVNQTRYRQG